MTCICRGGWLSVRGADPAGCHALEVEAPVFKQMLRFLYTDELVRSWAGLFAFRERAFIVLFGLAIPGILL